MSERAPGGFDEQQEGQRRAWLRLGYRDRLAWLEGAKRFARLALEAARRRRARGQAGSDVEGSPRSSATKRNSGSH